LRGWWWLTPVILATWEAEISKIVVWGQPRQKFPKTPSQPIAGLTCAHMSSQAAWEAEIGGIQVPGQPMSMENSWVCVVACTCHPIDRWGQESVK
jgi:hypothetical protein